MNTLIIPVNVTEVHIAEGEIADCYFCPIARALSDNLAQLWPDAIVYGVSVSTDYTRAYVTFGDHIMNLVNQCLPNDLNLFANRFDHGRTVKPLTTTIKMTKYDTVITARNRQLLH